MRRLIPEAADDRTRLAMLRLFYDQSLVSLVAAALLVLLHTAYAKGSVFPTYMAIPHSVDALVMVLLGGVQTMAGPVEGAQGRAGVMGHRPSPRGSRR